MILMLIGIVFLFKYGFQVVVKKGFIMLRFLLAVFKDYGLDAVQLGIIGFFGWKLFTNHLKHITDDIKKISKKVDVLSVDISGMKERVSKIEGKIE